MTALLSSSEPSHALNIILRPDGTPDLSGVPGAQVPVYMAESIALAVLENLVHMSRKDFPSGYVCVAAVLPLDITVVQESAVRRHSETGGLEPENRLSYRSPPQSCPGNATIS
jgi:hypothetical protein